MAKRGSGVNKVFKAKKTEYGVKSGVGATGMRHSTGRAAPTGRNKEFNAGVTTTRGKVPSMGGKKRGVAK